MAETNLPTNRLAIISLCCAILTIISFCIGAAPIPLTGWVCFPAAILFGLIALITGMTAARQIRRNAENGLGMAIIGASLGSLTILATFCSIALTASAVVALVSQAINQLTPTP